MFATKLQGASLFLLICRDLQDSVLIQEERTRAGDAPSVRDSVRDRGFPASLGRPCMGGTARQGYGWVELVAGGRAGRRGVLAGRRNLVSLAGSQVCGLRLPHLRSGCARGRAVGLGANLRPGPRQGGGEAARPLPAHAAVHQSPVSGLARGRTCPSSVLARLQHLGGADVQRRGLRARVVDVLPWSDATGRSERGDRSVVGAPRALRGSGSTAGRSGRPDRLAAVARGPRYGRWNRSLGGGAQTSSRGGCPISSSGRRSLPCIHGLGGVCRDCGWDQPPCALAAG